MISLYLNLIYPSASRRKVLTFIFEGRTWAAGPELGCAGKRLSPALRRVSWTRMLSQHWHTHVLRDGTLPLRWRQLTTYWTYFWSLNPTENNFLTCSKMYTFQPGTFPYMLLVFCVNLQIKKYLTKTCKWDEYSKLLALVWDQMQW